MKLNRQYFFDKYLNKIIEYREKYSILEKQLETATARNVIFIKSLQEDLSIKFCKFILKPNVYFELEEQKYIENLLIKD